MQTVFVRTNNKQLLGAQLARHAITRKAKHPENIDVRFINVDTIELFRNFQGKQFIGRYGKKVTYSLDDLQSFTPAVFMAPELMGYQGRAIVIDPDVFAQTDVTELFERDLKGKSLAARPKRDGWDTSVILLDCTKLTHWKMANILADWAAHRSTYEDWMSLRQESIEDLEPEWNSWDSLTPATKMLHTTNRLTQPWKTGLKIDFTRPRDGDRYFGLIPKPWIWHLLGKYPTRYQPHPDKNIERFFFELLKDALAHGAVTKAEINDGISAGDVRPDIFSHLKA